MEFLFAKAVWMYEGIATARNRFFHSLQNEILLSGFEVSIFLFSFYVFFFFAFNQILFDPCAILAGPH